MGELQVVPWRRYGHDRLYVRDSDGTSIGCWDNRAGVLTCADPTQESAIRAALAGWLPDPEPAGLAVPTQTAVEATRDLDLASTKPGGAARQQASRHREAAPVRTFVARVLGVHTDERAWRIGAKGEEMVAARLGRLGPEWRFLHAVPVGDRGSDIDHVAIGPAGVFTINAKHHPNANVWVAGNTFLVNGQRQPYIRNSRFEAVRASRLLTAATGFPVAVTGVVAVAGAHKGLTIKEQPRDRQVHVVARKKIADWLKAQPGTLSEEMIDAIFQAARVESTWQTTPKA